MITEMNLNQYLSESGINQTDFATNMKRTQGRIAQWLKNGVPPLMAIPVEAATGGLVPRYISSPEIYPPEQYRVVYPVLFQLLYSHAVNNKTS